MPTTEEVSIRRARPEDYEGVCRLMEAVDALHRERLPWLFQAPDGRYPAEEHFAQLLRSADAALFVADAREVVGVAIGVMRAASTLPIFIQQRWGVLDALAVDPAWRNRGIGTRLAREVEAWAIGAGAPWIEVNVFEVNPDARRLYERLGYLPMSTKLRKESHQPKRADEN